MHRMLVAFFLAAALAAGAGIDGRWAAKVAAGGKGAKSGRKGNATPGEVVLSLKADGSQLSGTVVAAGGKRGRSLAIQDGKLDGEAFSFTTVQKTKKGDQKWTWRGTLRGDEISGTRTKEGARRGQSFTAKRHS
jgi:hypothetical protein